MKRLLTTLVVAPLALALLGPSAQAQEQAPSRTLFDVGNLKAGAPPELVWARTTGGRSIIHGPAGETTVEGTVRALAPMGSGYVVQTSGTGLATTRWIGADGTPGAVSWRGSMGLAVSAGGEAVAFTGPKGRVSVIDSEGDRVLRMPRGCPQGSTRLRPAWLVRTARRTRPATAARCS